MRYSFAAFSPEQPQVEAGRGLHRAIRPGRTEPTIHPPGRRAAWVRSDFPTRREQLPRRFFRDALRLVQRVERGVCPGFDGKLRADPAEAGHHDNTLLPADRGPMMGMRIAGETLQVRPRETRGRPPVAE